MAWEEEALPTGGVVYVNKATGMRINSQPLDLSPDYADKEMRKRWREEMERRFMIPSSKPSSNP